LIAFIKAIQNCSNKTPGYKALKWIG
jgi:hypothetical protein